MVYFVFCCLLSCLVCEFVENRVEKKSFVRVKMGKVWLVFIVYLIFFILFSIVGLVGIVRCSSFELVLNFYVGLFVFGIMGMLLLILLIEKVW